MTVSPSNPSIKFMVHETKCITARNAGVEELRQPAGSPSRGAQALRRPSARRAVDLEARGSAEGVVCRTRTYGESRSCASERLAARSARRPRPLVQASPRSCVVDNGIGRRGDRNPLTKRERSRPASEPLRRSRLDAWPRALPSSRHAQPLQRRPRLWSDPTASRALEEARRAARTPSSKPCIGAAKRAQAHAVGLAAVRFSSSGERGREARAARAA